MDSEALRGAQVACRNSAVVSREQPADRAGDDSEQHQEADVPREPVASRVDVVDAQNFVVDDSLDEIKGACTNKNPSQVSSGTRKDSTPALLEEQHESSDRHNPAEEIEETIGEHVELHRVHVRRRHATGEHVMPLQDGVQSDSIPKASETNSERNARGSTVLHKTLLA